MDSKEMIDEIQCYLGLDFKKTQIADIFGISSKTVNRYRLSAMKYSDLSDDDILDLVIQLKQNHPNDGEVMLNGHLMAMDPPVKIPRWKLRAAIHYCDAEGVKLRRSRAIKRRQYFVPPYDWCVALTPSAHI